MKFRANKMLGLAIGERSILVAEVLVHDDVLQVSRAGEFSYPEGALPAKMSDIGTALHQFLKAGGYVARVAIVGIPAKWVLTKSKELPPIAPSLAPDMLRLQIEQEFSSELKDLVYDYAGDSSASEPSQILLAAAPNKYIEQVQSLAESARIEVQAIAPTTVILGIGTTRDSGDAMVLSITRSGTELMARRAGNPALLRHLGSSSTINAAIAGEVRRASLQMASHAGPQNGSSNGHSNGSIVVWNDLGDAVPTSNGAPSATALVPAARSGRWEDLLGVVAPASGGSAAAVALAVAGVWPTPLPIDFLHSRLAPPKKSSVKRQTILAVIAAVVVIVGIIYAVVDLHRQENELANEKTQLATLEAQRKPAEDEIKMISQAQDWHTDKPRYLQCLNDITQVFPDEESVFATSLVLHKNLDGSLSGKTRPIPSTQVAEIEQHILALDQRLKDSKHFRDVHTSLDRKDDKSGAEVSFTIMFNFAPHD